MIDMKKSKQVFEQLQVQVQQNLRLKHVKLDPLELTFDEGHSLNNSYDTLFRTTQREVIGKLTWGHRQFYSEEIIQSGEHKTYMAKKFVSFLYGDIHKLLYDLEDAVQRNDYFETRNIIGKIRNEVT